MNPERQRIVDERAASWAAKVAVRFSCGCCGAGSTDDLTCCQIAEIDDVSFAGRCDAGMAMTRTDAMPAATTTAIETLSATLNSARRPDSVAKHGWRLDERGLHLLLQGLGDGLGEHLGILTALGSLPGVCGGGSSVVNRGRHSAACLSTASGSPLAARSLNSRGA